jgi:hypothetical protein
VQRRVTGDFAHAADYSWLQGVLEKAPSGPITLRYSEQPAHDPWGGSIRLADDARLNVFRDGDVIAVEGELVREADGSSVRYRVRAAWQVRQNSPIQSP